MTVRFQFSALAASLKPCVIGRIDWMLPSSQYTFLPAAGLPFKGVVMPMDVGWSSTGATRSLAAAASAAAPPVAVVAVAAAGAVVVADAALLLFLLLLPHAASTMRALPARAM